MASRCEAAWAAVRKCTAGKSRRKKGKKRCQFGVNKNTGKCLKNRRR